MSQTSRLDLVWCLRLSVLWTIKYLSEFRNTRIIFLIIWFHIIFFASDILIFILIAYIHLITITFKNFWFCLSIIALRKSCQYSDLKQQSFLFLINLQFVQGRYDSGTIVSDPQFLGWLEHVQAVTNGNGKVSLSPFVVKRFLPDISLCILSTIVASRWSDFWHYVSGLYKLSVSRKKGLLWPSFENLETKQPTFRYIKLVHTW